MNYDEKGDVKSNGVKKYLLTVACAVHSISRGGGDKKPLWIKRRRHDLKILIISGC